MNLFIEKLIKEKKIKLVDSSDEISRSYLIKSDKSLISSKTLLDIGNYDDAIALTYYSMYYSVLSLLFKCGVKCENHTGAIILLKEIFGLDNHELDKAKKDRIDGQYYIDFKTSEEELRDAVITAEEFNANIKEKIERLKKSEIIKIHEKFKKYYF